MSDLILSPTRVFFQHVSSEFLEDTLRCLIDCYRRASENCSKAYPWQVAHDLRPYMRRAEFEKEWPLVVEKYPEMQCDYCQNVARNCWHVLVRRGPVVLTQSFVDQRLKAVRRAMFRDTYARSSVNYLFPDMALPTPSPDAPLYAILSHDSIPKQTHPVKIEIIFPDPEGEIVARIDLVKKFPWLFTDAAPVAEEVVGSELDIDLTEAVKEKRKSV